MRNKVVGIVGAGALVLALAACSNTPASSGGGKTLTIAAVSSDKAAVEAALAGFKEKHPDIDVTATYADGTNYQTSIRTQLSSATAPDVFYVFPGSGNPLTMKVVQQAGYLADLSNDRFASTIPDGEKSVTQVDGKTYIAPISFTGLGAVWNTTALEQAGLQAPKTWSDVLALCSAAQSQGKTALALAAGTDWNTQLITYALAATLVYGPDPDFAEQMDAGTATFAHSAWATAMDKYLELQKNGCFQPGAVGTVYDDALKLVATGQAFGSVQVSTSIATMQKHAPKDTKFTMAPFPATDDASSQLMAGAVGASFGMNAKAKNPASAKAFLEYITSSEGVATYAKAASGLPALPTDHFTADPALKELQQYLADGKTVPFMDQLWPNPKVQQVHLSIIQQLLSGSTTVPDALAKMDEAFKSGS
jgi:raffinose/stachyose/melibiose transport system substrate-binding protein